MKREFVLRAGKASTTGCFSLNNLPSDGGRMDLVARCVCSALWISNDLRRDTSIHIAAGGGEGAPAVISFHGENLVHVSPDERSIAAWIKKALESERMVNPGISVMRGVSFRELVEELALNRTFYVLDERGDDIRDRMPPGLAKCLPAAGVVFILGDHTGLPEEDGKFIGRFGHGKISLGKVSYLSSQCITILHYVLDRAI